jgi:hypothetical protein
LTPAGAWNGGEIRLGLVEELQRGFSADLMAGAEAAAAELRWTHRRVNDSEAEAACDVLLAIGDVRLFPDLVRRPPAARRVLWHGEVLPRQTSESGSTLHRLLPTGRLLDAAFRFAPPLTRGRALVRLREQAAIVREPLANLRLLRRASRAFDLVVVDSADRAEGALGADIPVAVVPYGYHAAFAGPLRSPAGRDIDVLLLGHLVGRYGRRQRLADELERRLAARGVRLARMTTGVYGAQRNAILERTRVVADLHRLPGNHPGFRFLVVAAAGAAMVTEPLARPEPLVAGTHYAEASAALMADAVLGLLAAEPERRRLVDAAQELLAGELHMRHTLPLALGLAST